MLWGCHPSLDKAGCGAIHPGGINLSADNWTAQLFYQTRRQNRVPLRDLQSHLIPAATLPPAGPSALSTWAPGLLWHHNPGSDTISVTDPFCGPPRYAKTRFKSTLNVFLLRRLSCQYNHCCAFCGAVLHFEMEIPMRPRILSTPV